MMAQPFLFIIIGIVAFLLTYFFYFYKFRLTKRLKYILFALRFVSLLVILLIVFVYSLKTKTTIIEKPKIVVAIDNTFSIKHLKQTKKVFEILDSLKTDDILNSLFDISYYSFDKDISIGDSISFKSNKTNLSNALSNLKKLYTNNKENILLLLITDGNSTEGQNYTSLNFNQNINIFPLPIGDTIQHADTKITRVNSNHYAFKNNEFPVEIFTTYNGKKTTENTLTISEGRKTLFSKIIQFDKSHRSEIIQTFLKADKTGIKKLHITLTPLPKESNTWNNKKEVGIEILDKKVAIVLISDIVHPDIGTLKKSLQDVNAYDFKVINPKDKYNFAEGKALFILYQPNKNFEHVVQEIEKYRLNYLLITGDKTDWSFLNNVQKTIRKNYIVGETENNHPILNTNYPNFVITHLSLTKYPPLSSIFGQLDYNIPLNTIFYSSTRGIVSDSPLLATTEAEERRRAFLFGEGLWKWRMNNYIKHKNFENFDDLFGKLFYYLSLNNKKKRLIINNNLFYKQGRVEIIARYFNKNYTSNNNAQISISIKNQQQSYSKQVVMQQNNGGYYNYKFNNAPAGNYTYKIKVENEGITEQGEFKILEYNPEKEFISANIKQLKSLALQTNGTIVSSFNSFKEQVFTKENNVKPFVKTEYKQVSLLNIKSLLLILVLSLSIEWVLRKRNGLL